MKPTTFKKSSLAVSVSLSLAAGLGVAMPTWAQTEQDNAEKKIEVSQVKGIRGSLIRSMDLKRQSSGVVDAISAEEMGKFPDTNLAESLQRITGVSVSRANGEGSQITVRGFGPEFNLITLWPTNAEQVTRVRTTQEHRLRGVNTRSFKPRVQMSPAVVCATVNIVTPRPFQRLGSNLP